MNILLLASHAVAEYDDLRMLTDLGYDVFAPGGYANPQKPAEAPAVRDAGVGSMRPSLPYPYRADLDRLCMIQREKHAGEDEWGALPAVDWAKADLHPDLVDWADTIIVHHFPKSWIGRQWSNIKHKRVIWRTCGQSGPELEYDMQHFRRRGLQIVRYSPKEKEAFEKIGSFAGEDAMIRFGKYPADWYGWTGKDKVVGNLTQSMTERRQFTGLDFYLAATEGLPVRPSGGYSEELPNGTGFLSYDAMRQYLRDVRVYLYTGTAPASYTLALIEAMMTGTPVVSITPEWLWPVYEDLFEGHKIAGTFAHSEGYQQTKAELLSNTRQLLMDRLNFWRPLEPGEESWSRKRAIELFSVEVVGPQWLDFLGSPARVTVQHELETVTA